MAVTKREFGITKDGEKASIYTMVNKNGMKASVTDYGAILVNLLVPDTKGKIDDVVLGYDRLEDYFTNGCFFGATIGPVANRTKDAKFEIGGVVYQLDANDNGNNLHSHHQRGFHQRMWDVETGENFVRFSLEKPDMDMGFPGNVKAFVTYTLTDANEIKITYDAITDKDTIINMTNHSYFNLTGPAGKDIHDHILHLKASRFTPVVQGAIPTGELKSVKGTPFDFTEPKRVGDEIDGTCEQLSLVGGYDHNWVVDGWNGTLQQIATVEDPVSGRKMEVFTDLPGVQFYAGNCITEQTGKKGARYGNRKALCLETQYYPNSANEPNFIRPVFGADKPYHTVTIYKFIF